MGRRPIRKCTQGLAREWLFWAFKKICSCALIMLFITTNSEHLAMWQALFWVLLKHLLYVFVNMVLMFSVPTWNSSFQGCKLCHKHIQKMKVLVAQLCLTLCNPMGVSCQAPLSMGFLRLEYWSGSLFPSPGDLPHPGIDPGLLPCRWILYCRSHQGSPQAHLDTHLNAAAVPPPSPLSLRLPSSVHDAEVWQSNSQSQIALRE